MAVEEMEKSAASDNPNPNNTDNNNRPQTEDDEPEEGEIVGSDGDPPPEKPLAEETHQLEHSWTFWFDDLAGKANQVDWGSSIRPIYTFSTVEQFWSVYNNIRHPSKLVVGTDFYCFKHEIKPKWEDPVCAKGGKWSVNFYRGKSDTAWLYTLLAMIGEQFDHGDEICGAVINIRAKQDKIGLWTKTALNESAQMSIGRQWKEFLDYNGTIGFIVHEDAKKHERSAKNTYSL